MSSAATLKEIDDRIATARQNLRDLIEQAAAHSGAADDELASQRIADQEKELDGLIKKRALLAAASGAG